MLLVVVLLRSLFKTITITKLPYSTQVWCSIEYMVWYVWCQMECFSPSHPQYRCCCGCRRKKRGKNVNEWDKNINSIDFLLRMISINRIFFSLRAHRESIFMLIKYIIRLINRKYAWKLIRFCLCDFNYMSMAFAHPISAYKLCVQASIWWVNLNTFLFICRCCTSVVEVTFNKKTRAHIIRHNIIYHCALWFKFHLTNF